MKSPAIQEEAYKLQVELWRSRHLLDQRRDLSPLQVFQPEHAAFILDVDYQEVPTIGEERFGGHGERYKAAGAVDINARRILISTDFPATVRRFTGAHEIGHWILHRKEMRVLHRERPVDGPRVTKDRLERDADYFAACFLIPEKLLFNAFCAQFGVNGPITFTDTVCYHLNQNDHNALLYASEDSLDRELALARCASFNGRHMISLSAQFGVSDTAMAIRIKELGLSRWP